MRNRYDSVIDQIESAAARSGRTADDVMLIAVSKTFPASDVRRMHRLGQVDFGENKVQELVAKSDELVDLSELRWHMIGHLQRNKAKDIVGKVELFHALDSVRLGRKLQGRLERQREHLDCLVQVNISGEHSKFGIPATELDEILDRLREFDRLRLRGLMTLASPVDDPEKVRPEFAAMRRLANKLSDRFDTEGGRPFLSMGMSGDYEVAIEEGSTHVRIGSALFGERSYG